MGYTLKIGEAEIVNYPEDGYISIGVKGVEHKEAPAFGEPTDFSNQRWPSYTSWHNFARFVGLHDLFYDEDEGLIRRHPDTFPLTPSHKEIIDKAYEAFKVKYPDAVASFAEDGNYDEFPEENTWLVRLEWLKYWVDWSLENCQNPVFYNS